MNLKGIYHNDLTENNIMIVKPEKSNDTIKDKTIEGIIGMIKNQNDEMAKKIDTTTVPDKIVSVYTDEILYDQLKLLGYNIRLSIKQENGCVVPVLIDYDLSKFLDNPDRLDENNVETHVKTDIVNKEEVENPKIPVELIQCSYLINQILKSSYIKKNGKNIKIKRKLPETDILEFRTINISSDITGKEITDDEALESQEISTGLYNILDKIYVEIINYFLKMGHYQGNIGWSYFWESKVQYVQYYKSLKDIGDRKQDLVNLLDKIIDIAYSGGIKKSESNSPV